MSGKAKALVGGTLLAVALAGCGAAASSNPDEAPPGARSMWTTDFSEHSVPLDEFVSGGPPKDGIPSIDDPDVISAEQGDGFLDDAEPVAVVEVDGAARAYPLQILVWHEIVNDELAGAPIGVTFCPLCNSTVAFSREVDGRTLEFGTTGMLRRSDLVMYDRETESWWQQLTAEAVVGELTGTELDVISSRISSWGDFKKLHPEGDVISRDTGESRDYGTNPYARYDRPDSAPFLFDGDVDSALPPKERVAAVTALGDGAVVYPFSRLAEQAPINDEIGGEPVVVVFDPGVASALDSPSIAEGREVGAAAVFERNLGRRTLNFVAGSEPGTVRDRETGSSWDAAGRAMAGPLRGERLEQVPHDDQFWFALAAFHQDPDIRN